LFKQVSVKKVLQSKDMFKTTRFSKAAATSRNRRLPIVLRGKIGKTSVEKNELERIQVKLDKQMVAMAYTTPEDKLYPPKDSEEDSKKEADPKKKKDSDKKEDSKKEADSKKEGASETKEASTMTGWVVAKKDASKKEADSEKKEDSEKENDLEQEDLLDFLEAANKGHSWDSDSDSDKLTGHGSDSDSEDEYNEPYISAPNVPIREVGPFASERARCGGSKLDAAALQLFTSQRFKDSPDGGVALPGHAAWQLFEYEKSVRAGSAGGYMYAPKAEFSNRRHRPTCRLCKENRKMWE
jgi:hypothetical protein